MAYVNFGKKNTKAQALASDNPNKIFFPTDATSIIMGGKEYGIDTVTSINGKTGEVTGELIHLVTSPSGTTGTKDVTRTQWTGTVNGIASLYTGLMITIKVPNVGVKNSGVTLDINNLGEHPVVHNVDSAVTTHYAVGTILTLIYDAEQAATVIINSVSTTITGCWKLRLYDSNNDIQMRLYKQLTNNSTWNKDYPLVASRSLSSSIVETDGKYAAIYGLIGSDDVTPTVNPITGAVKVKSLSIDGTLINSKTAAASGTDLSLVTTGEKAVWNAKQDALTNPVTGSSLTAEKIVLGNGTTTVKTSSKGITTTAPTSSSDDTTLPTSKAVWDAISASLAASDAMVFKGTLGTNGTVTAVPTTNVVKGDTYKVITAGTWAGSSCKVGDLLIALASGNVAANTTNWAYVPSGDENVTTIATADSPNVSATAQSGAVTLGTVVTKAVETSLTNVDTAVPTSKAVKSFVEGKGYTTNTGTVTKVTAGTGLSIGSTSGGNFTTSGTINHTNSVTAQTTQAVYPIKIDAQGHISAYGNAITPLTGVETAAGANINSVGTPSVTAETSGGVTTLTFDYLKGATGTAGADGSTIWTASAAPTSPDYTFAISALSSTPNTTPKVGDIVVYSVYRYTITSVSSSTVLTSSRQSIRGAAGTAATISIGTVTTGNAGTSATVTNSGTASAAVLDFVIPKGDPGINATTTSVFSSSASGLAPSTASGNITTAESSSSVNYLCSDGKWRPLPSGAWKTGTVTSTAHTITVQSGLKSDGSTTISGTSSSAASPTVALGDSGVTAGTYKRVTVNAKGIVIGGDNTDADHYDWSDITNKPLTLTKNTTGFSISGGTTSKTLTVGADYTLGAACAKGVTDNSSNTDVTSSDTNLITGRTLYYQLAKKGYTTNTGTITGITMNGASKGTSGVVDLGTVLTSHQDISGKQDKVLAMGSVTKPVYVSAAGTFAECNSYPTSLPASDVSSWAKQSTKPTYIMSEVASISSQAISADTSSSCSITGAGNAGKSETIIYTNSGSSDLTVTVPTTYQTPDGNAIELTCPAGGYCEVNYLNIGGTIYARGL